jgi:hypothetical protein
MAASRLRRPTKKTYTQYKIDHYKIDRENPGFRGTPFQNPGDAPALPCHVVKISIIHSPTLAGGGTACALHFMEIFFRGEKSHLRHPSKDYSTAELYSYSMEPSGASLSKLSNQRSG